MQRPSAGTWVELLGVELRDCWCGQAPCVYMPLLPLPSCAPSHLPRTHCFVSMPPTGVNLLEVMCHPDVDFTRTVSNDIIEILQASGAAQLQGRASTAAGAGQQARHHSMLAGSGLWY